MSFRFVLLVTLFSDNCQLVHLKINSHLVVSSLLNPLANMSGPTYSMGLLEKEFLQLLARTLNFTYQVRAPPDFIGLGSIVNGTGTGVLGQLIRMEVDVLITAAEMTWDKAPYVDASYSAAFDTLEMIVPYPQADRESNPFVTSFTITTWAVVMALLFVSTVILSYFACERISTVSVYVIGLISSQGNNIPYTNGRFRVVWGTWSLMLIVLANLFTRKMTSNFTVLRHRLSANSIEDVVSTNMRPFMYKGSMSEHFVRQCHKSVCEEVRHLLDKFPELLIPTDSDVLELLSKSGDGVFLTSPKLGWTMIAADTRKHKTCRFTMAKVPLTSRPLSFLFQKNSPLTGPFNGQLLRMRESGIVDFLLRKYVPDHQTCSKKSSRFKQIPVQLLQLKNVFIFLIYNMLLSTLTFATSLLICRFFKVLNSEIWCLLFALMDWY